ncbi:MAG: hypothetical protein WBB36_01270, partial [Chitinophagales bacterium]
MLKKKLFALLLVVQASIAFAQDYTPFIKDTTTFFLRNNWLMGVRFDSVKISGNDSVFISYPTFRDTSSNGGY